MFETREELDGFDNGNKEWFSQKGVFRFGRNSTMDMRNSVLLSDNSLGFLYGLFSCNVCVPVA